MAKEERGYVPHPVWWAPHGLSFEATSYGATELSEKCAVKISILKLMVVAAISAVSFVGMRTFGALSC